MESENHQTWEIGNGCEVVLLKCRYISIVVELVGNLKGQGKENDVDDTIMYR